MTEAETIRFVAVQALAIAERDGLLDWEILEGEVRERFDLITRDQIVAGIEMAIAFMKAALRTRRPATLSVQTVH